MRKQAPSTGPRAYELKKVTPQRGPLPSAAPISQGPLRNRRLLIIGSGLIFGFIVYRHSYKPKSASEDVAPQDFDYSARFNATADKFDEDVDCVEWLYGITKLRRKLVQQAHGNVLEAAVGTGRNSEFYDLRRVTSLTLQDQSTEMLEIAKEKWRETHPDFEHCRFIHGSALEPLPPAPGKGDISGDGGYDTIIATMSLCSTPGPSLFLRNLAGHLSLPDRTALATSNASHSPGERLPPRILLLEHGRSYFSWLNYLLDRTAPAHAKQHGCWWNRDIGKIAEDSGLEIINTRRKHFGTTWFLELGLPAEAEGVNRQQWLEDTRQKVALLQAEVGRAHVEWKERIREQEEIRRKDEELEVWRREQREHLKKES
ncbi:MAG: hypothetical protein Q9171_000529 [Xanthocarpia ochracea]